VKTFEITPLREADLLEVVEIEEMTGLNRWGFDAYRREILTNPFAALYAARPLELAPRRIFGFVASSMSYDELHINNIASHPDYRRLGIGRSLLTAALDEGRLRGARLSVLEVRASNVTAQALYEAFGYRVTRRRKAYYRAPSEDALEMILDL
jgi:[ribosomal protein S18]-alanine N-acetyltransferase